MFGDIGWQELVLTLAILALVFGAGRVADIGGALGRGVREFRDEVRGSDNDTSKPAEAEQTQSSAPAQSAPATTVQASQAPQEPVSQDKPAE